MSKLTGVLAVTAIVLGAVCVVQWQAGLARQTEMMALRARLEEQSRQVEDLQAAQERADQKRRELLRMTAELAAQPRVEQPAEPALGNTNPSPPAPAESQPANQGAGGLGGMFGKMMSDPTMKDLIRNQQRLMLDQLYRPLIKQLGLSAEEAAAFKDLLAENTMKGAEKASLLLGGLSATNRAELVSGMAAEQRNTEEQLKAFLGEPRYAIFKEYQETVGERAQLNAFRQQNDLGEYPLNDLQVEQLLGLMKDEKRIAAAALGMGNLGQEQAAMEAMFSEDQGGRILQAQEMANERVFERARSVLSPDQLQVFGTFQTNQLQMLRMGLTMARRMMVPADTPAPTGQ